MICFNFSKDNIRSRAMHALLLKVIAPTGLRYETQLFPILAMPGFRKAPTQHYMV